MESKDRNISWKRITACAAFAGYSLLMIWLLFGQRADFYREGTYMEQLRNNLCPIPFRTTAEYVKLLLSADRAAVREAVINLGGNIIMFLPLGFLLPLVFHRINTAVRCAAVTVVIIAAVEIIQLFTLLGVCDIDDLIFNTCGSIIGYGVMRLTGMINRKTVENC